MSRLGDQSLPLGPLPYPVPGGLNKFRGAWVHVWNRLVLCYLILARRFKFISGGPGSITLSLSGGPKFMPGTLGTLLPYPSQGDSSSPQGGQGLLPYLFQGLSLSLKLIGTLLPYHCWVLCYLVLHRRTWVYLRGARVYYLIKFRRTWVCPWNCWILKYSI